MVPKQAERLHCETFGESTTVCTYPVPSIGLSPILPCLQEVFPSHTKLQANTAGEQKYRNVGGDKPLFWGNSILHPYRALPKLDGDQFPCPSMFRWPCTGIRQAKPGQSGLGKLSPACAAPPAPPAPRQALPWRNLCGSKSAHSSRQHQAYRAERHACAAPSCLACLSLPVPRACATVLHCAA